MSPASGGPAAPAIEAWRDGPRLIVRKLQQAGAGSVVLTLTGPGYVVPDVRRFDLGALAPGEPLVIPHLSVGAVHIELVVYSAACVPLLLGSGDVPEGPTAAMLALAYRSPDPAAPPTAPCATPVAPPTPTPGPTATPAPGEETAMVKAEHAAGAGAWGVAVSAAGTAWVTNAEAGTATRIAADGAALPTLPLGREPRGVALTAAGQAWIALAGENAVLRVSPAGAILGRSPVATTPWKVALDGAGRAWVTHLKKKRISVIAPDGTVLKTHKVDEEPDGIAIAADGSVWYASPRGDEVVHLSAAGKELQEVEVEGEPTDLAIGPDGHVYVVGETGLTELSATGRVLARTALGETPAFVAVDPLRRAWVTQAGPATVVVAGPTGFHVGLAGLEPPAGVAIGPDGDAWVANPADATVYRLAR